MASPNTDDQATDVVRWPQWCGLLPLVPLVVLALSALAPSRTLIIPLSSDQPALSEPFQLEGGPLGSPLITLRSDLPLNSSMVLDVELLDLRGEVVLQLSKQAWRQSGAWYEDGESGTWEESDNQADLSLRPPQSGSYRLRLTLDELLNEAGQPLITPIVVQARVRQHDVDAPLLWYTALITFVMVRILQVAVYRNWRQRLVQRVEDNQVAIRLRAGGAGLLRVAVRARYERPSGDTPPIGGLAPVRLTLSVAGPRGEQLLKQEEVLAAAKHSSEDDHWLTVAATFHLRLPQSESVRVRVELSERIEDGGGAWEIEWLQLVLEDGLMTPQPVRALPISVTAERT